MTTATAFQGELMLAGWGETHNGGAKLTFWLPDAGELDAFRALTVRKGNTAGQRFMAVLVQIGDDELPLPAPALKPSAQAKPGLNAGSITLLAVRLCQSPDFYLWATEHFGFAVDCEKAAADVIKDICNIDTRAKLDHNGDAAQSFHESIRKPYLAWRQSKGLP